MRYQIQTRRIIGIKSLEQPDLNIQNELIDKSHAIWCKITNSLLAETAVPEPTAEELEKGRHEWGIKYNDECLKFEKEWEIIAKAVQE